MSRFVHWWLVGPGKLRTRRIDALRNDLWVRNRAVPMWALRKGLSFQTRAVPVRIEKQSVEKGAYQHLEFNGRPPEKGMNDHEEREVSRTLPDATPH